MQAWTTWDIQSVRELSDVAQEAIRAGNKAHIGRISPIAVQRNSELPDGHPQKVYTGRIVYGCEQVKDENSVSAICEELSSSPAGIEASKSVDAYGPPKGN